MVALFVAVAGTTARATDDLTQGLEYFKTGKYAEAAARFQVMVDSSPKYAFGYHMLGLSYLQLGRPKEAEVSLLKAIDLDGTKFQYHHGLARSYLARRDSARAIATLKTAEPLATTDELKFPLYSLRGFAYATLEKWPEAVDDLEKARAIQPQAAVLVQLGRAYMHLGYAERAEPAFRQAAQANASDAATNERLAEALLDMAAQAEGKRTKDALYREALQIADRVLTLRPNEYQSYNLVGRAALGAQDYVRAEQSFRKVLVQRPDHCYAMTNLGKTYMAQERWAEAEAILANATVCAPRLFVALESLGHAQQVQAKLPQAIQSYEMAQEIKASDAVARAIATCKQDLERHGVPEGPTPVAEIETKKRFEEAVRKAKESGFKRQPEP